MDNGKTFSLSKDYYFKRYAWKMTLIPHFNPPLDLEMVVVIPAYKEPQLSTAVRSILNCQDVPCKVIILVIINAPEQSSLDDFNQNKKDAQKIY